MDVDLAEVRTEPVLGLLDGARWYPGPGLVFADMTRGGVYSLADPGASLDVLVPHRKGVGGLALNADGGLVVSGCNVSHERGDATEVLLECRPDEQFFNDLSADAAGSVYVGSVAKAVPGPEQAAGRLYRIGLDGELDVVSDDVLVSNGLAETPDRSRLYHVDSGRRSVWKLLIGEDDTGRSRELFADTSEYAGVPDGIALGSDGTLWVAIAGGGVVVGWDETGHRVGELALPHLLVTDVCFGGVGMDELFVLTGVDEEHPDAEGGRIFHGRADLAGVASPVARVPARLARA